MLYRRTETERPECKEAFPGGVPPRTLRVLPKRDPAIDRANVALRTKSPLFRVIQPFLREEEGPAAVEVDVQNHIADRLGDFGPTA